MQWKYHSRTMYQVLLSKKWAHQHFTGYTLLNYPQSTIRRKHKDKAYQWEIGYFAVNPILNLLFFIRESGKYGKHKENNNYSKKNITIGIDQDPINQLVYLMFKLVTIFKSSRSLQLKTSLLSLSFFNH